MKVVLDIETIPAPREAWARLAGITLLDRQEPAGDLFAQAEQDQSRQAHDDLYAKSAFDGTYARIVCIGALFLGDDLEPRGATSWYGVNEKELLQKFWQRMAKERPQLWITHNGLGFDLPFIKKRSVIHQVRPPFELNLARFRTEPIYDTMAIWSNWDTRGWVKLDTLARALGVETKSGSGDQVLSMWERGEGQAIAEYCLHDTYVTYACYCRMTFRTPLSRDVVLLHHELIDCP